MRELKNLSIYQIKEAIDNMGGKFLTFWSLNSDQIRNVTVYKENNASFIKYNDKWKGKRFWTHENKDFLYVIIEYSDKRREEICFLFVWELIRYIYLMNYPAASGRGILRLLEYKT